MTSRQVGRRISTIAAERKRRSGRGCTARKREAAPTAAQSRRLIQLVACGGIFVLLVTVKLLLPGKLGQFNAQLSDALRQNMDVQAVFSAVGRAFSGEEDVGGTLEDVYQAVFNPGEASAPLETAALPPPVGEGTALAELRQFRKSHEIDEAATAESAETPAEPQEAAPSVSTLAYVQYSSQNLPENVSMEQALLGFDYCTPVSGVLSSGFGYREHPVEGEERFHYGMDLAADTGTAVACFADGQVTAVGESSSYGKYLIVTHSGGYATLYAHCSRVTASSGASVHRGDKIAEVGETGMATGPHLHFELHLNDTYLNPIYYVTPT